MPNYVNVKVGKDYRLAEVLQSGRFKFIRRATPIDIKEYGIYKSESPKKRKRKSKVFDDLRGESSKQIEFDLADISRVAKTGGCISGIVDGIKKKLCFGSSRKMKGKAK